MICNSDAMPGPWDCLISPAGFLAEARLRNTPEIRACRGLTLTLATSPLPGQLGLRRSAKMGEVAFRTAKRFGVPASPVPRSSHLVT